LLTFSLTLEPACSLLPGRGRCEITLPLCTLLEYTRLIFPMEQCARLIARFARLSFLPFTLGTTQSRLKVAVAERFALIVSVQVPVSEQLPDQPVNFEREEAAAVRVTAVPCL